MSNVIDHRAGQYRAELCEELIGYVLQMEFPDALIRRDYEAESVEVAATATAKAAS